MFVCDYMTMKKYMEDAPRLPTPVTLSMGGDSGGKGREVPRVDRIVEARTEAKNEHKIGDEKNRIYEQFHIILLLCKIMLCVSIKRYMKV